MQSPVQAEPILEDRSVAAILSVLNVISTCNNRAERSGYFLSVQSGQECISLGVLPVAKEAGSGKRRKVKTGST